MKVSDREIIEAAKQAQSECIRFWMREKYVGGGEKLASWNRLTFSVSKFKARDVRCPLSDSQLRKRLDNLAAAGEIERHKDYGPVSYRFPSDVCDRMAKEAIAYWSAHGLREDKIVYPNRMAA